MSEEFSLRSLTREVWNEMGSPDYHVLAKEVARRITAKHREAALNEALTEYARQFVTRLRPQTRRSVRRPARSAKVAGIRAAWPALRATYLTRDGQKALGECTRIDVVFIAENLDKKARECQAKASWMRDLAAAMKEHGAVRVRDLPDDVLASFVRERAA